jgi:hypothetical protein
MGLGFGVGGSVEFSEDWSDVFSWGGWWDLTPRMSGSEGGPGAFKRLADLNIVVGNKKGGLGLG